MIRANVRNLANSTIWYHKTRDLRCNLHALQGINSKISAVTFFQGEPVFSCCKDLVKRPDPSLFKSFLDNCARFAKRTRERDEPARSSLKLSPRQRYVDRNSANEIHGFILKGWKHGLFSANASLIKHRLDTYIASTQFSFDREPTSGKNSFLDREKKKEKEKKKQWQMIVSRSGILSIPHHQLPFPAWCTGHFGRATAHFLLLNGFRSTGFIGNWESYYRCDRDARRIHARFVSRDSVFFFFFFFPLLRFFSRNGYSCGSRDFRPVDEVEPT